MGYKRSMTKETGARFCPACGRSGFAAGRRCKCLACGFVYFQNVAAAAAAIIEVDGRILLTRRAFEPGQGLLDLPGGFIEPGETAEDGLRRELQEELGLAPVHLEYLCSLPNRYPFGGVEYRTLDLFFVARLATLDALTLSDEISAVALQQPEEIKLDELAFESIRGGLAFYLETLKDRAKK